MDPDKQLVSTKLDKIHNGEYREKDIFDLITYGIIEVVGFHPPPFGDKHFVIMTKLINEYPENNKDIVYCKALLYGNRIGRQEDAIKLFTKASELGCVRALCDCAELYLSEKNYVKAYELYCEAAKKDISWAYYRIAWMRNEGIGVEKDIFESFNALVKYIELSHDYPAFDPAANLLGYNMLLDLKNSINDLRKQTAEKDALIKENNALIEALMHAPGGQQYLLAKNNFDQLVDSITDKSS